MLRKNCENGNIGMKTIEEILEYIEDNGVKFVKLSFCDIAGRLKCVSVNAAHLADFTNEGFVIDASASGAADGGDLLLFPEPDTITAMPWRPSAGAVVNVMCRLRNADGTPFACDCGKILEEADEKFKAATGCEVSFMTESEFYIMKRDDHGEPTLTPVDNASYLDAAPLDTCENLRREIVFTLETMGMQPLSSHHEKGKGQNAVIFRSNTAYRSAVNTVLFRSAVRNIAYTNGLYATFAPCPIDGSVGSNFRIVAEITRNGRPVDDDKVKAFMRGIAARASEMAAFTNPVPNSYDRLALPETPCGFGEGKREGIRFYGSGKTEITFADTACNPFVTLALILAAGAEGMTKKRMPDASPLPTSLGSALDIAETSAFVKAELPREYLEKYLARKRRQAARTGRENIIESGY